MTLSRLIASGFGAGFSPVAPGTVGSLLGLAIGAVLLWLSPFLLLAAILLMAFGGMPVISHAVGIPVRPAGQGAVGDHADPGWVVLDEIAGQCLAFMALTRPSWGAAALAFALFRFFDITKLGPIGWADRQGGAWGIMADDLIAGFAACLLVGAAHVRFPDFV